MKKNLHQNRHWIRILNLIPALIIWTIPILAQDEAEDEEVFELSPFEVDASQDMGYYASQTLAGGRLSTDIINTGSSIEVVTADFMDDIGAADIQELLMYTTGTEVGGNLGNFVGAVVDTSQGNVNVEEGRRNPDANARIRGLASPDRTRDFFKTDIPFDQYNTERVDINRGSNSFLFGLGSPAGLINNQLSKANFNNRTRIRFRLKSGADRPSFRGEMDINREIIKDVFAVRVATMVNREKYRQEPAYRDDNRVYGTLTYHPFDNNKKTTIRAHWESGDIISNAVENVLPGQNIDTWIRYRVPINIDHNIRVYAHQYGYNRGDINNNRFPVIAEIDAMRENTSDPWGYWPIYELETRPNGSVRVASDPDGSFGGNDPDWKWKRPGIEVMENLAGAGYNLVYDGTSPGASFAFRPNPNGQNDNFLRGNRRGWRSTTVDGETVWYRPVREAGDPWWSPNGRTGGNRALRSYANSRDFPERGVGWFRQGFTNLDTFDFTKAHLGGESDFWENDFYNYNVTVEQLFLDGRAGIEVAYDYQYRSRNALTFLTNPSAEVAIDINQTINLPQIDESGNVIYPEYDELDNAVVDENGFVVGGAMPNPNFGRPYINSRRGTTTNFNEKTVLRATAFYKLDFERYSGDDGWLKWLGQHTLSLLGDKFEEDHLGIGSTLRSYSDDFNVAKNVHDNSGISVVAGPRQVGRLAYLGPPVQSYLGDQVWDPRTPLDMSQIILEPANYNMLDAYQEDFQIPIWYWERGEPISPEELGRDPVIGTSDYINGDERWELGTLKPRLTPNEANQVRHTEVDSWAINAQSFFLDRHLVINTGYREDYIDSWLNRAPPKFGEEQVPSVDPDVFRPEDGDYETVDKGPGGSGTFGYGAVVHWPKEIIRIPQSMDISFHYNYSKNFIPDTSRRTIGDDITLRRLASPQGESKDYGVTFQLFDRRLIIRLNWYEGSLDGADARVGNIFNQNINKMFNWYGSVNAQVTNFDSSNGLIDGEYDGQISNQEELDQIRSPQLDANGDEIPAWEVDQNGELVFDQDGYPIPLYDLVSPIYELDENGLPLLDDDGIPLQLNLLETNEMVIDRELPNWGDAVAARQELQDILFSGYWQLKESRDRVRLFQDGSLEQENISGITDTESVTAEGFEASITWNPTRNWRMRVNVAQQETVNSSIAPRLERFITEDWLPWVLKWGDLDWNDPAGPNSGATLAENVNENLIEYFTVKSLEGFPTDEVREWRVNLVTNYSFRDGPLDGFNIGGSLRWQSDAAIGYPLIEDEVLPGRSILVGDVNNAYYGDEQLSYDFQCGYSKRFGKVNWQIQLNLRNLQNLDSNDLDVLVAQPDGSAAKVRWEPPFQWQITNTFRW